MNSASRALLFVVASLLVTAAASSSANGQATSDTLAQFPARSINGLIDRLPGRVVPLRTLTGTALREALPARLGDASRRIAEANALAEGRAVDPSVRLGSGVASDPASSVSRSRTSVAGISSALPWGTELGADYTRGGAKNVFGGNLGSTSSATTLSLSQPFLEGFNQRTAEWRATTLERTSATYTFARTRERVAADIESLYWTLAEAQATEAVYLRSLELSETLLSRNVELARRELIAEVDVLTVRSGVAIRRSTVIQSTQARRDASDALVFATFGERAQQQLDADTLPLKAEQAPDERSLDVDVGSVTRTALARRADVAAATALRDATIIREQRARNALRPNLALEGGFTSSTNSGSTSTNDGNRSNAWRLGLSLSAPVFNRGDRGVAQLAAALHDIAELQLRTAENAVRLDVRESIRAVRSGRERLDAAELAASLAWDQLIAERRRLELGLGDSFRLLQTEENAVQAQLAAVRARYDLARAHTRYRLAIGAVPLDNP